MNETHRFLRYVMPGASFSVEALLILLLLLPEWTMTKLGEFADAALGGALVAFLGLGSFGFLFSIVHHLFRECPILGGVDSRLVIERLRAKNAIEFLHAGTCEPVLSGDLPDRDQAWVIVNALWHQRVSVNPRIHAANPRVQTLADLVHSIGTAQWGALFAGVSFVVASFVAERSCETIDIWRFIAAVVLWACIVCVHYFAYRRTSRTAEALIAEILEDALTASFMESGVPVRTHVDLRRTKADSSGLRQGERPCGE